MSFRRTASIASTAIAAACAACSSSSSGASSGVTTVAATDLAELVSVADSVGGVAFVRAHPRGRIHPKGGGGSDTVSCQSGTATIDDSPPKYSFDFMNCQDASAAVNGSVTMTTGGWVGDTETLTFSGGPLTITDATGTHTLAFNGPLTVTIVVSGGEATITTSGSFTIDGTTVSVSGITVTVPLSTPEGDAGTPVQGGKDAGSDAAVTYSGKTLYGGQSQPGVIAVDDTNLYWQDESSSGAGTFTILRAPKAGGGSSKPATLATLPTDEQAVQILADGTNVYWTQLAGGGPGDNTGQLVSMPVAGGTATTLVKEANDNSLYGQFAIDGSYAYYWVESTKFQLNRTPLAGGTAEVVATVDFPSGTFSPPTFGGLAVDGTNVYWTQFNFPNDDEVIAKAPKAGGTIVTLYSHPRGENQLYGCVVDSANVYWLTAGAGTGVITVSSVPIAGGALGSVGKPTLSNLPGDPSVLPTGLALLNDDFYFSTLQAIVAMPKSGGSVKTLALTPLAGDPVFFTADTTNVYWSLAGESPTGGSIVSAAGF